MPRIIRGLLALASVLALVLISLPALAVDSTSVDLGPTATLIVNILLALAAAGATVASHFLVQKLRLDTHSQAASMVDDLLQNAVHFAVISSHNLIASGAAKVDLHSAIAAQAVNYAQQYGPGVLARFGLDPNAVGDLVLARLARAYPGLALPDKVDPSLVPVSTTLAPDSAQFDATAATPAETGPTGIRGVTLGVCVALAMLFGLQACTTTPGVNGAPAVTAIDPAKVKQYEDYTKLLVDGLVQIAATAEATGKLSPAAVAAIEKAKQAEPLAFDAADKVVAGLDGKGDPTAAILALQGVIGDALQAYIMLGVEAPLKPAS